MAGVSGRRRAALRFPSGPVDPGRTGMTVSDNLAFQDGENEKAPVHPNEDRGHGSPRR